MTFQGASSLEHFERVAHRIRRVVPMRTTRSEVGRHIFIEHCVNTVTARIYAGAFDPSIQSWMNV